MQIATLGITNKSDGMIYIDSLQTLEDELRIKNIDIVLIGNNFPSIPFARDIVLFNQPELYRELKNISPKTKIIFLNRKR
jgi:hypothetical protein